MEVPAILQLLFLQSMSYVFCASVQFLDRVLDIPVGYLVGDAQCTMCTGPWSSTGPVFGMVLSARCCATTGAVADSARVCLVRQWIHSAFLLGAVWKNLS